MPESSGSPGTIQSALDRSRKTLCAISPTARLDAEVLLAHVLGQNRAYLRARPEALLTIGQREAYSALIASRCDGMPIAYLTGRKEFWSRDFIVSPRVLIPRPETELLIELVLRHPAQFEKAILLDLATGSGAIAVSLAAEITDAVVYASDISEAALQIAGRNAERLGVSRVRFLHSDWFQQFPVDLRFDLIVSNPPYIADSDPHLSEGDVRFEPDLALRAGMDGFDAFRIIADQARARLVPGGWLLLEHGYQQAADLQALLHGCGYRAITHHRDLQGHPRATGAFWAGD